jgi:biotin-(acetyl-CoA carboxylase) ligase
LGHDLALEEVAAVLLNSLEDGYHTFTSQGFSPFIERWERVSALTDVISFERNGQPYTASVTGLNDDGKLIVNTTLGQEFLAAEEVSLMTPMVS